MLDLHVPAGQPMSLPPDVLVALAQALRQPAGVASSAAVRPWVQPTSHLDVRRPHTLDTIARPSSTPSSRSTWPAPHHKPLRRPSGRSRRPAASRGHASSRPRIRARCACSAQDARRGGVRTVRRRRLTARGVPPVGIRCRRASGAWPSGDGAVAPTTGSGVASALPDLQAEGFQLPASTRSPRPSATVCNILPARPQRGAHRPAADDPGERAAACPHHRTVRS